MMAHRSDMMDAKWDYLEFRPGQTMLTYKQMIMRAPIVLWQHAACSQHAMDKFCLYVPLFWGE